MRIFLAGATGAIGKRLLPMLVRAGHEVTATTRHPDKVIAIRSAGAIPVLMNALDSDDVMRAVQQARPEVIIHQLTAIPARMNLRRFDEEFTMTNRLRTKGTDYLLAGARTVGCRRFIAQSYAGWYERRGSWLKTEEDPLMQPAPSVRDTLTSTMHLESAVLAEKGLEGFVLRYGMFYGPGTSLAQGGWFFAGVQQRRVPIVGGGNGHWSFIHVDDAAAATVCALCAGTPGIYNITDDEPAPVSQWLPFLANVLNAKPPRHTPAWLARLAVGQYGVAVMTELRGALNRKAKSQLLWRPQWPTWRRGFQHLVEDQSQARDQSPMSAAH